MAKIESSAPGSFCWADLAANDPESAQKFYTEMFGWTVDEDPGPAGIYYIFKSDGNEVGAMYKAQPGVPPHWGAYFSVANVDVGRIAILSDAQGAFFSLVHLTAIRQPESAHA